SIQFQAVILPHTLLIVEYSLGHPGSVYNTFTFQSTYLYKEHANLSRGGWHKLPSDIAHSMSMPPSTMCNTSSSSVSYSIHEPYLSGPGNPGPA
ncbi:hypothetical protein P692DRAFT_20723414, partial [Suillus brevipes Sb2]